MPVKKEIRSYVREYRKNSIDSKKEKLIIESLLSFDKFISADVIFCYASLSGEISTDYIIVKALNQNKKVALPRCIDNNGKMEFFYINCLDDIKEGSFGVREPDLNENNIATATENSLIIVPAMAFDKNGYRVGYGKGYYDRYLEKCLAVSVGLCYNDLVINIDDKNVFDKSVDYLITETKITEC